MTNPKISSQAKSQSGKGKTSTGLDEKETSTPKERMLALAATSLEKDSDWLNQSDQAELFSLLIKNKGRRDLKFAQALVDLDKWSLALNVLEELEADTSSSEKLKIIEDTIHYCKISRICQEFKVPFKDRVAKVWTNFQKSLPQLQELLEEKKPNKKGKITVDVGNIFSSALAGEPLVWLEKNRNDIKIRVLLESLANGFEWQYIKEQIPEALKKDWPIEIINCPQTDKYLGLYVEGEDSRPVRPDFDVDTISLLLGENLTAFAYCEDWEPFLRYKDFFSGEYDVVQTVLRHFLGDVACIKYIPKFFVLNIQPPETTGTLLIPTQLPKFFADKGIDIHAPVDEILDTLVSYEWVPSGSLDEWHPRDDFISGRTMCKKFLEPYLKNEVNDLDQLEADGIGAGYFYYKINPFKGENTQKERERVGQAFKKELIEKAGADLVKIVGEARGEKYDYVDVLAWDSEKVLNIAKTFFKRSSKNMAYFRTFRRIPGYLLISD